MQSITRPMRAKEVAAALGVDERTVWRWLRTKEIKSVKIGGSRFIPIAEAERVINGNTTPPQEAA